MLILNIVYEGIVSNETSFKQFSLEIKSFPLFGDNSYYYTANSQFCGMKKCHMSHSTFCNQWNLSHVLIRQITPFVKTKFYSIFKEKKLLSVEWSIAIK